MTLRTVFARSPTVSTSLTCCTFTSSRSGLRRPTGDWHRAPPLSMTTEAGAPGARPPCGSSGRPSTPLGKVHGLDEVGVGRQLIGARPRAEVHAAFRGQPAIDGLAEKWEERCHDSAEHLENRVQRVVGVLLVVGPGSANSGARGCGRSVYGRRNGPGCVARTSWSRRRGTTRCGRRRPRGRSCPWRR